MKVGELFVALGIDAETEKAKGFESVLVSTTLKAAGLVTALIGVSLELRRMINESLEFSVEMQRFEKQTGLSAEKLQYWQIIAERANVSADDVSASVSALGRNIANINMGRGDVSPFQMMGINPRGKDPFTVLSEVQEAIKGMNRPTAVNLMEQMGITPDMIMLLSMTTKEMKALAGPDLILSDRNKDKLLKVRLEFTKLRQELTYIGRTIVSDISPILRLFANFIGNLAMMVTALVQGLLHLKGVIPILTALFIQFMSVIAPITTAIMGLLLILEDLYVFSKGGKSVFGELADWMNSSGKPTAKNDPIGNFLHGMFTNDPKPAQGGTVQNNHVSMNIHGPDGKTIANSVVEKLAEIIDITQVQVSTGTAH